MDVEESKKKTVANAPEEIRIYEGKHCSGSH